MRIEWPKVLPVIVSIGIIISIAILRQYSKAIASIAATMPINIPLGLWIVASGTENNQQSLIEFTEAVFVNIFPTVIFIFVAWQMIRTGHGVLSAVVVGYGVWGLSLIGVYVLRALLQR